MIQIFSLKAVAEKEGVQHGYLRVLIHKLQKADKPLEWRGYKFVRPSQAKQWLAVPKGVEVEFVD